MKAMADKTRRGELAVKEGTLPWKGLGGKSSKLRKVRAQRESRHFYYFAASCLYR